MPGGAKGRVDVIAEDGLRRSYISGQHRFDSFSKKLFSELGITLDASANGLLEIASERYGFVGAQMSALLYTSSRRS